MTGLLPQRLSIGTRFSLKNQAFEITFIDAVNVRYAACAGGRIHTMPTTAFWEFVDSGVVGFLDKSHNVPSLENGYAVSRLSDTEREQMLSRYKFVQEAMRCTQRVHSRKNLKRAIETVFSANESTARPGISTLSRWIQRFISSGCDVTSLVPRHAEKGYRQKRFSIDVEHIINIAIRDDFLTSARPTVRQVHANVIGRALEYGFKPAEISLPSSRTIYRRINELDPYIKALKRNGKRYADLRFRAAGASTETSRLMELVMMDGHRMDVIVIDKETGEALGRPYLVCLFDVHTRAVVGWHISLIPFCSTTALAAIKDMCSRDPLSGPGGVPETIITDNGPDLVSNALRNLLSKLEIHVQSSKTYCPDDKAFLERFFRTLCTQLVHILKGSTFSSPTQRGDYDSVANASISLEDLRSYFKQWLEETYHQAIHSVTNRAPALSWRDKQAEMPILSYAKEDLDAIARISYRRKISNGRVIVDNLAYKSDALATFEMRGQQNVTVMVDEMNLEYVYVSIDGQPRSLIRADCVKQNYANKLTKYEHQKVQEELAKLSQNDRDELGVHAHEIARWRLWNTIHKLPNSKSTRKLKSLEKAQIEDTKVKMRNAVLPVDTIDNQPSNSSSRLHSDITEDHSLSSVKSIRDNAFETIEI
ncbi:Uncharacterized conserved protein [Janthinobacterium sp. Marseille]|nr:DDE-type integrase/transposase/recombinase [Janthinobacterium sp. Marseille]ABR91639.1 Uncharacterized conserved protein [Janthinobacterium sp. Marseille]